MTNVVMRIGIFGFYGSLGYKWVTVKDLLAIIEKG